MILNQNLTAQTWALNPTGAIHDLAHGTLPRGTGNAVSVEFNVCVLLSCPLPSSRAGD